jgi:phosphoribosylformimino-5-aminoimidazole carboxamide ribotide isomerase
LGIGRVQLIASGGISSLKDLQALNRLEPGGLIGAIVGKALYEGQLNLREAIQLVGNQQSAISNQ